MKVTTNIQKSDLLRLNLGMLPKLRSTYVTIVLIALLSLFFICWKGGIPETVEDWLVVLLSSFVGGIFGVLIGAFINMVYFFVSLSPESGILGEHEYTLVPEGFHESTSVNEGLSKWNGVTKVGVCGQYLLLQISGRLFHIIPARSFDSSKEFQEFVSLATELWKSAHNKLQH